MWSIIRLQSPRYVSKRVSSYRLTYKGLLNFLGKRKAAGTLSHLAGVDGLVNCVFICCDLPYQYIDEYFDKVSTDSFHPIKNQVSTLKVSHCDVS
jgi:hypothetical protein